MIGQIVRDFEIVSEIGAGGYGAVYRARDTSVNRDVAIKVILPQFAENPDFKQRFEAEAQLVAQLENPRIVPLYAYWQDEQGAFLVMRYIRGGSLRHIMAKQEAFSLSQTIRILSDIADALDVAHEQDVVHRDLKPENILIDERGNAYLTDFGIAKRTTEAENITEADAIVGTWAYLSPEQIQNNEVSPRTDIYAFGILLYEMLAGKHPFQREPATMMVMKHLQESLPDLSNTRPDLPQQLDDIIKKATAKDPEERYASMIELLADLKQAAGTSSSMSVIVPKITQRKKPTSPEERNRYAMLQNVRKFWIEGVLENSVQDALLLNLGKSDASSQINNPWDTVVRTPNSKDETLPQDASILNIFERMNGKLLILGEPGSGKTTTLLELARELLNQADVDDAHPIPVIFNLSSWAEGQPPLEEWLRGELSNKYQVPLKVASGWVENDELLLMLDGLDEVKAEARDACVEAINAYRTEHGFVDMVVCSRISDYEDLSDRLLLNGAILIQALSDEQIDRYLEQVGPSADVPRQLLTTDPELLELARSPLMLNIITQAYQGVTGEDLPESASIEERRQHVFKLYVESTLRRRGTSAYAPTDTKRYLTWIANALQLDGDMIFHLANGSRRWMPKSRRALGDLITFSLTFLVMLPPFILYAWGFGRILDLPVFGLTLIFFCGMALYMVSLNLRVSSEGKRAMHFGPINSLVIALIIALGVTLLQPSKGTSLLAVVSFGALFVYHFALYQTFAHLIVRYNELSNTEGGKLLLIETLSFKRASIEPKLALYGLSYSISITILFGVVFAPSTELAILILALIVGGSFGVGLSLLQSGLDSNSVQIQDDFDDALHASGRTGYLAGGIAFLVSCIPVIISALIIGMDFSTSLAIAAALSVLHGFMFWGLVAGGAVASVNHLLRWLRIWSIHPPDFREFLNYATDLILLRKVGGGYIFVHRYLLEYFADLETEE